MVRASTRPDGMTAPIWSGFSIHERRKRTSSSRRSGFFNARTDDCNGISLPGGTASYAAVSANSHKDVYVAGDTVKPDAECTVRASCERFDVKAMRCLVFLKQALMKKPSTALQTAAKN